MSDQQIVTQTLTPPKYPNSFLFGFCLGASVEGFMRKYTMEPLAARPLHYVRTGLILGGVIWYWDYWRRCIMENVMQGEEKYRYY